MALFKGGSMDENKPKRVVTVRVAHTWEEEERLDREWWARFTPDQKVAMLWPMTLEGYAVAGLRVQPRLQRLHCRVER